MRVRSVEELAVKLVATKERATEAEVLLSLAIDALQHVRDVANAAREWRTGRITEPHEACDHLGCIADRALAVIRSKARRG